MRDDVGEYYEQWEEARGKMKELVPDVMRGFGGMFQAIMKKGALSVREKELIAVAIGVALRCAPCVDLHVQASLKAGATREQILEAAGVAVVICGGASLTYIPEVIAALEQCESKG